MIQRIKDLYNVIDHVNKEITELQSICKHPVVTRVRYRKNDEYDQFAFYANKCRCQACDKFWMEDCD